MEKVEVITHKLVIGRGVFKITEARVAIGQIEGGGFKDEGHVIALGAEGGLSGRAKDNAPRVIGHFPKWIVQPSHVLLAHGILGVHVEHHEQVAKVLLVGAILFTPHTGQEPEPKVLHAGGGTLRLCLQNPLDGSTEVQVVHLQDV